jgi:hypothetical protein
LRHCPGLQHELCISFSWPTRISGASLCPDSIDSQGHFGDEGYALALRKDGVGSFLFPIFWRWTPERWPEGKTPHTEVTNKDFEKERGYFLSAIRATQSAAYSTSDE